ncbi:MAG: hypothetical protein AAGE85_05770 [Pseudomonadota bacterium]
MLDSFDRKPTFSFWVIGAVALLWNLLGLMLYVMQVSTDPELLAAAYTAEQFALIDATPAWATAMTAIATNAGVLASVLLLLRRRASVILFAVSLAAIVVQDIYIFGMTSSVEVFGVQVLVIQSVVLLAAVLLLWYARRTAATGMLR